MKQPERETGEITLIIVECDGINCSNKGCEDNATAAMKAVEKR